MGIITTWRVTHRPADAQEDVQDLIEVESEEGMNPKDTMILGLLAGKDSPAINKKGS